MARRRRLSRGRSGRSFRRSAGTRRKNVRSVMRGGFRI